MKKPDQWLKERCVPEGPLWDKQPSWKEWIEAIQEEAFKAGRDWALYHACDERLSKDYILGVLTPVDKPLAKSQSNDHQGS